MTKGVDISVHNGIVDFHALKVAGIQFVIIRCGYGSDFTYQDDERFAENVRKAEAADMPWGTYLYSYALNRDMAKSEAQHVLRLLAGKKPAYGVWYDVEDAQQAGADLVSICETFCTAIEKAGLYVGVYSALSWWNTKLNNSRLDRWDKWVAQWNSVCEYAKPYGIWQNTDHLTIGGKAFDGNFAYKDYPALTGQKKEKEEAKVTYEQWKEYMTRYQKEQGEKAVSGWAEKAVEHVKETGTMVGDGNGKFRPHSPVTRQELAQVLYNRDNRESDT